MHLPIAGDQAGACHAYECYRILKDSRLSKCAESTIVPARTRHMSTLESSTRSDGMPDRRAGADSSPGSASRSDAIPAQTQALIVGGGPCGLMLPNELGRRGIGVVLVDQKTGTAFNPQANATQARTMELYRRLGFAAETRAPRS